MQNNLCLFLWRTQLAQLNTCMRNVRKSLNLVVKFFCAVLLYFVLNFAATGAFKSSDTFVLQLAKSAFSLRDFICQNLVWVTSLYVQYKYVAVSLAVLACVFGLIVKTFVNTLFVNVQRFNMVFGKEFFQRTMGRANVFSYKQHVAFLA
ncbi:MAG: hypothetical protein ACI4QL_06680 [Candidatus Fimimonas sp.]